MKTKATKRQEAKERQSERDKRSNISQIVLCCSRRGESKKELARLRRTEALARVRATLARIS